MQSQKMEMDLFRKIIGSQYVIDDHRLESLTVTTFATSIRIKGAIYPGSRDEVIACIKIANEHKIKLYPISQGKNIGLGAQIPNTSDCVILNLSRLNRILDFNEALGYISIEPGVTQADITTFLKNRQSKLMLSVTGSFAESSIIGNAAERGDTTGPYIERCDYICNMGVVLANGDYIKTGAGQYQHSKVQHLSKWGIGPDLTGLFIQSNLGIIIDMTVWLSPIPADVETILFTCDEANQLEKVSDVLRELKLKNVISTVSLRNDYKVVAAVTQYPWDAIKQNDSLESWLADWRQHYGVGRWNGLIMLRASAKSLNQARKQIIYRALRGLVSSIISTSDWKFYFLKRFSFLTRRFSRKDWSFILSMQAASHTQGITNPVSTYSLYWRKRLSKNQKINLLAPEQDQVGFIWCSVYVPAVGRDIVNAVTIAEKILREFQYEPNLCVLFSVGDRAVMIPCAITYDRAVANEDDKAMRCYNQLLQQWISAGYYPNRLGIQSMHDIATLDYANEKVHAMLKKYFDPNNIFAPERYDFQRDNAEQKMF